MNLHIDDIVTINGIAGTFRITNLSNDVASLHPINNQNTRINAHRDDLSLEIPKQLQYHNKSTGNMLQIETDVDNSTVDLSIFSNTKGWVVVRLDQFQLGSLASELTDRSNLFNR